MPKPNGKAQEFEHVFEDLRGRPDADDGVVVDLDGDGASDDFFADVNPEPEAVNKGGDVTPGEQVLHSNTNDDLERDLPTTEAGGDDTPSTERKPAAGEPHPDVEALRAELRQMQEADRQRQSREQRRDWETQVGQAEARLATDRAANEAALTKARKELTDAMESGNTASAVAAQETLAEAKARKLQLDGFEQQIVAAKAQPPPEAAPPPHALTTEWMQKNPWFLNPQYAVEAGATRALDAQLKNEGFDAKTPAFWAEMDKRLRAKFKDLPGKTTASPGNNQQQNQRGARVAPTANGGAVSSPQTSGGKVKLTSADFGVMRRFKLDPRNPEHVKEYARSKRQVGGR